MRFDINKPLRTRAGHEVLVLPLDKEDLAKVEDVFGRPVFRAHVFVPGHRRVGFYFNRDDGKLAGNDSPCEFDLVNPFWSSLWWSLKNFLSGSFGMLIGCITFALAGAYYGALVGWAYAKSGVDTRADSE